jgi:hypothetical protein
MCNFTELGGWVEETRIEKSVKPLFPKSLTLLEMMTCTGLQPLTPTLSILFGKINLVQLN